MNKITIDELAMSQLGGSVDPLRWLACNIDAAHPVTVDLAAVSIENKLSLWAEERGRLVSFNQLIRAYGGFDQNEYGFVKFKAMIEAGDQAGYFALNTAGLRDWLTLPRKDRQTAGTELPDDIDLLFQEIVTMIKASTQSKILLTSVKQSLIKKYGGFDESVYGYNRLKELMQEGERLGYFTIGRNGREIDYVSLAQKRTTDG